MKKQLITSIKIGSIALVLILGATHAFAFRVLPDQTTNAYVPVNVGPDAQTMKASFGVTGFLKAGSSVSIPTGTPTWNESGFVIGETNMVSPKGIMKYMFLPSKTSQLKIGSSAINVQLPAAQPFTADMKTPLIIDMKGRGNSVKNNPTGREAIDMIADGSTNPQTAIRTAAPAIEFNSSVNAGGKADIIAGALQLSESNAGALKVLVATDTDGNAVWGSMRVVTNSDGSKRIQVDYPGSPVATGQNLCGVITPPVVDLCTNIADTQTTVPAGMTKDTAGNAPGVCTTPPVDMCPNIADTQTTVPTGMIVDGSGNCVTSPVDLCPNINGTQTTVPVGMIVDGSGNCVTSPVDLCPNINGTQTTVPVGMIVDGSGNCVTSPVDLCPNINGTQTTVPVGMVKDTSGNTPGNCTTPPVDVCPNIAGVQENTPAGYELNNGQCGRWLSYGKAASTSNGQTCRSWIQTKTPGWPYAPIESGKFRTVSRENLGNGLTGNITNIYPDQCIYGRYSSITLNGLNGALLSSFDNVPTQSQNYFGPRSSINGGTPWVIYEFQYFYPQ